MAEKPTLTPTEMVVAPAELEHKPALPGTEAAERDFEIDLTIKRLKRHLDLGELIAEIGKGKELSMADRNKLASIIEGRSWNTVFSKLRPGDTVATFLVPSGVYAIKNLNDAIFGPQGTDDIIEFQKNTLKKLMDERGFDTLKQDYKVSLFRVSGAKDEKLKAASQLLESQMHTFIMQKIEARRQELERKGLSTVALEAFAVAVEEQAYWVSYGVSEVTDVRQPTAGDFSHIESALVTSMQAAKLNTDNPAEYGSHYDVGEVVDEVASANRLREEIVARGNKVVDKQNLEHDVFAYSEETGLYELNRDVLRMLRKDSLKAGQEIVELLQDYKQKINLLDIVKPYIHDEIAGNDGVLVVQNMQIELEVASQLRAGGEVTPDLRQGIVEVLSRDQKDVHSTSPAVFHREAVAIPHCTYICIDVLDVGVDLLLEYERAFQLIAQAPTKQEKQQRLRELSMTAGDEMTKRLRYIRDRIRRFAQETIGANESLPMMVGGDEITLALKTSDVTPEFLFGLQQTTGSRVVASEVERLPVAEETKDAQYRRHVLALREAEAGVIIAKKIEDAVRFHDRLLLEQANEPNRAAATLVQEVRQGFVVREEGNAFFLVTKERTYQLESSSKGELAFRYGNQRHVLYGAILSLLLLLILWR